MYAANSFIRIANFIGRSIVGFAGGVVVGYLLGSGGISISDSLKAIGL